MKRNNKNPPHEGEKEEKKKKYIFTLLSDNEYLPYMSSFVYSMFLNDSTQKKNPIVMMVMKRQNNFKILVLRPLHGWRQEFRGVSIPLRSCNTDPPEL